MSIRVLLLLVLVVLQVQLWAQHTVFRPSPSELAQAPVWAQMMYAEDPVVWAVDSAYKAYYRTHAFQKNQHTQAYKRWRRACESYIGADGRIDWPSVTEKAASERAYLQKLGQAGNGRGGGAWQVMGPMRVYDSNGDAEADHTNIYALAQSPSNPDIMYAGTEPGEVYKSTDGGTTWNGVTQTTMIDGGVRALAVDPNNPDIVLAAAGWYLYRSTNGGQTWTSVLNATNLYAGELQFQPSNSQVVLAATEAGLYRSTNGGASFTQLYPDACWDVKFKPGDPNTAYLLKHNGALIRAEFFVSTDAGATWTLRDNGWYSSSDPNRSDIGGRLGVTAADPNRVYAYLIGDSKTNDYGFIGLYRSDDGGQNWTLPNGPAGGPYSSSHPNLARGTDTWNYHQGYYNCALMVSKTHADSILIGGLNLWRSNDGGLTFSAVSGYIGGPLDMHVDNQDFRAFDDAYWISTDGGIYRSLNFFTTQPTVRMDGIHGADYWGFGSGWNDDVLVGGMYHNGNNAWRTGYGSGNHLALGGGEAPTGYVNPGNNRRTYFSDIGGKILPNAIGQPVQNAPFGLAPNETYWSAESSEMEFHPHCYNVVYLGRDHQLWRSNDGGGAFHLVNTFGTNLNSQVKYIEIARSNPDVIYLSQQPASGNNGQVWKTTDGGQTWNTIPLPSGPNRRRILLALDPENENLLTVAFPQGGNGQKVYRTSDGGSTWTNLTSSLLDGEEAHTIAVIGGTNGGTYFCSGRTVFYRDNTLALSNWVLENQSLLIQFNSNIARPFYRDGKLRIASYGMGIWENDFHTQPSRPIATPMVNMLSATCETDSFYFEDHSMLNHAGATWDWTFQNGSPTTSNLRNPAVVFSGQGQHMVVLQVTAQNGQTDRDTMWVQINAVTAVNIAEGFETQFPPVDWRTQATGPLAWTQNTNVGGFGASSNSAACDNYNVDAGGSSADLQAFVNLDSIQGALLSFDVAYAEYGGQYTDTLEVLVSTDCGQSFTRLYRKGGQGLATAPNFTSSIFVPTAQQWRTDSVDLSAYLGQNQVLLAFRSIGHWGQIMYLDNVNLNGSPVVGLSTEPVNAYAQLVPNPVIAGMPLKLHAELEEVYVVRLFGLDGKLLQQKWMRPGETLSTDGLSAGTYLWELSGSAVLRRGKLLVIEGQR